MRIERWNNKLRVSHPIVYWFGLVLPLNVLIIFASLAAIIHAVRVGWLR